MKRSHPFRFEKRDSKRGKVFYVRYDVDPARPKSTGIPVDPKENTNPNESAGYDDAGAWAYAHMDDIGRKSKITFREFAEGFFSEESTESALKIWLTPYWRAYFLMQWTCGLRPGEAGGFMLSDWIKEYHGAVIQRSIEAVSLRIKGLKTA